MQDFEVYVVPGCACDGAWQFLGYLLAEEETDALDEARETFATMPWEEIVCIPCATRLLLRNLEED